MCNCKYMKLSRYTCRSYLFYCQLLLLCIIVSGIAQVSYGSAVASLELSVSPSSRVDYQANRITGLGSSAVVRLRGYYTAFGPTSDAEGQLKRLVEIHGLQNEENWSSLSQDPWIGILDDEDLSASCSSDITDCVSVLDRVKKAFMFGASAIIILILNPKVLKQLDITQLFAQPIIAIEDVNNITTMLTALNTKLKLRVKISPGIFDSENNIQTYTVWSTCWRASPGSGVVCRSDSLLSKSNPSQFWSYFYSTLAVVMLLLLIKSKQRSETDEQVPDETSVGKLALLVLSSMPTRRYRRVDDVTTDICAICLDQFNNRQKIRVLPCVHEFHSRCVDQWLVRHRTCPLCKLDVIELQIQRSSKFKNSLTSFNISVL